MSNRIAASTTLHDREAAHASVAPGFAALLRERTALVHREAERTGFIADLIRGRATRVGYALFLRNLVPVYDALEAALDVMRDRSSDDGCSSAVLSAFVDRRLRRRDALRSDLGAIAGPAWEADLQLLAATGAYVRAAAGSERLVAHAYARYLGDLSGGQILPPVLARNLDLPAEALTFYDFPLVPDIAAPKAAMRVALDQVGTDGPAAGAIVEEAIAAFRHNIALSLAVQAVAG